jgi:hypothetical protein
MDLKEFVAASLTQIADGIKMAQDATKSSGAWISPVTSLTPGGPEMSRITTPEGRRYVHEVSFDVAITVSDEQKAGAGAGITIFGAKVGADGGVTYQNAAVSRVQFSVPIMWPADSRPEIDKAMRDRISANYDKINKA